MKSKELAGQDALELLEVLKNRFEANMARHKGLDWRKIQERLEGHPGKLWSLGEMERTGGEPDVIAHDKSTDEYLICDCSAESPKERRSLCYDREALDSRKDAKPRTSAMDLAGEMGIELLDEAAYLGLQKLGKFDLKTSSWIRTPVGIRKLGGAIFGDRRYDHVFVYHNGAESYYAVRGFRGILRI
jgi:hypothetical protein